jgi:Uma2 family endonuclease
MPGEDAMPVAPADTRLTYDDFLRIPDDGKRHEIIDGEHYVTPSPNLRHQKLVGRLFLSIGNFLAEHPEQGEVFLSPLDVVLSYHDVVEPDLLFVASGQARILTPQNVQGPPALVVEVMSKGTRKRDATIKRRLFERTGVREYWLVDPALDRVQVFRRLETGGLRRTGEVTAAQRGCLTTPLLPGWELSLETFFAK